VVGLGVADPEVALVGLAVDEIRGRWLVDDLLRHAEVTGQLPHLRLEEIAERIHRGRVVGVPGEVTEQALGLVAGT
jgi:hypothetical protein